MKNLLLLLFIPIVCLSQNDFRKMNWGESPKILKERYSDISFHKEIEGEMTILSHKETVGGIQTTVVYSFTGDKFFAGLYLFGYESYSKNSKDRLKDFSSVSARLNKKYQMTREDVWINDSWKDNPNQLDHALYMAHVSLIEKGTYDDTVIQHSLEKSEGELLHRLMYSSAIIIKQIQDSIDDDF
jgi:hypothetical protein